MGQGAATQEIAGRRTWYCSASLLSFKALLISAMAWIPMSPFIAKLVMFAVFCLSAVVLIVTIF